MNSPFTTYKTTQIQRTKKEANREDWLRFRREAGLGASEISGILGLAPWKNKTPLSIYLDKIGEGTPCETSLAMAIGTELEDLVASEFEKKTGMKARNFNTTLVDPVNHIVGDVDRLVVPKGESVASVGLSPRTDALLECKTHGGEIWDEVPAEYLAQVQTYMHLTGCVRAYVACLFFLPFGGKAVEVYTVKRDDATIEAIKACAKAFWENNVLKRVPPLATSNEEVARKYPKSFATSVEADDKDVEAMAQYKAIDKQEKAIKKEKDALVLLLKEKCGDNESMVHEGKTLFTWKSSKDSTAVDWEGLVAENPDLIPTPLIAKFTKMKKGARRFVVK